MIPQLLIVDTAPRSRELMWVIEHYAVTEEEVLCLIIERLHYERDALNNLGKLGFEILEGKLGQEKEVAVSIAAAVVNLGKHIYEELVRIGAYVAGYLPYYYEPTLHIAGDLILAKLSSDDLELY